MNWLIILINVIATIISIGFIWRGFCKNDLSDQLLGVIFFIGYYLILFLDFINK